MIDLRSLRRQDLALTPEEEARERSGKGWSYISTYSLRELRDILIAVRLCEGNRKRVYEYVKRSVPNEYSEWEDRRILEQLNALINFGFLRRAESDDLSVHTDRFASSGIGTPLSEADLADFRAVYLNYFRFRELMTWFLPGLAPSQANEVTEERLARTSVALYSFTTDKYTNRFLDDYRAPTTLYQISDSEQLLLRFWDVFVKWGKELGLLCRVSLAGFDVVTDPHEARLAMVFFIGELPKVFDLHAFVRNNFRESYIECPKLVLRLSAAYRIAPETATEAVVQYCQNHRDVFSLERTSEAFIKPGQQQFYPKHRDSYISHLHLLQR